MGEKPADIGEEVRLLIEDANLCSQVAEAFTSEDVAAYGDYSNEPNNNVRIQSALDDGVDYVVFWNHGLYWDENRGNKNIQDLWVNVFVKADDEVKKMRVRSIIDMVKHRRASRVT